MTKSKGEARRMMKQGAVRIDNEKVTDIDLVISKGNEMVIKVGKRRFLRVK
jgi:tyrosyl-tRNA synthetase